MLCLNGRISQKNDDESKSKAVDLPFDTRKYISQKGNKIRLISLISLTLMLNKTPKNPCRDLINRNNERHQMTSKMTV